MNIRDQLYRKAPKSKKQLDWVSCKRKTKLHKKRNPKKQKKLYLQRIKRNFQ